MKRSLVFILLLCLLPWTAQAVTRYAATTGSSGNSPCTNSAARCDIATAWNLLGAGDELVIGSGTYNLTTTLNTQAAGTSGSKIYVHAEGFTAGGSHPVLIRGQIIDSNNPNAGNFCGGNWDLMCINHEWWIVEGLDLGVAYIPLVVQAPNVEIRHNLVHDFKAWGIFIYNTTTAWIHHNVAANMRGVTLNDGDWGNDSNWGGIALVNSGSHTIEFNASYSNTNNAPPGSGATGIGISGKFASDSVIRGNLFMDNAKSVGGRFFGADPFEGIFDCSAQPSQCAFNIQFRSNILAYAASAGIGTGENVDQSGVEHNVSFNTNAPFGPGKGNIPGNNTVSHNTSIMGSYSLYSMINDEFVGVFGSNTMINNLWYSPVNVAPGPNGPYMTYMGSPDGIKSPASANFNWNFYYQPAPIRNNWASGVVYGPNDIHDGSVPVFANAAQGDYSLASGPGNNAASDSTDMGANWDGTYLKSSVMQSVVNLPMVEQGTTGTSHTLNVSTLFGDSTQSRRYQLWGHIPVGYSPTSGVEQFTIQGVAANGNAIDRAGITSSMGTADPVRYIYLGTYYPNGSNQITVSWQNSSFMNAIQVRQMPTPQEAYAIMTGTGGGGTDPVAIWPMDESGATMTAADTTGGHTGTLCEGASCPQQGPTWVAGVTGNALHCDGGTDNVEVAHAADLDITGDLTIAFWMRLLSTTNLANGAIVLTKELITAPTSTPWHIELSTPATPRFAWYHHEASGNYDAFDAFTGYQVPLNTWIHAAFVRTNATKEVKLRTGSTNYTVNWVTDDPQASGAPVRLCADLVSGRYANIDLDDLHIYPRALTDPEVDALAASNLIAPAAPTNLRVVSP